MNTENWVSFVDTDVADLAIGGASIPMMIKSMNETMGTNYEWSVQGTGYYSKANQIPATLDPNNLYSPDHSRNICYMLSSPTYYESAGVIYGAGCYGGTHLTASAIMSESAAYEFRPVVHLKEGYKLQWNNNVNKFDIVNDKIG